MQRSILISILLLFVMSCKNGNNSSEELSASDQTGKDSGVHLNADTSPSANTTRDSGANSTVTQKVFPKSTNISMVVKKMENHGQLNDVDYIIINGYLLNNKDESSSEGVGYTLFEYLKGNKLANDGYVAILNKKDSAYKEKILEKLIQIMCIDLGDEKYTYEKLISDFSLFKESNAAQKALKTCMDNKVD